MDAIVKKKKTKGKSVVNNNSASQHYDDSYKAITLNGYTLYDLMSAMVNETMPLGEITVYEIWFRLLMNGSFNSAGQIINKDTPIIPVSFIVGSGMKMDYTLTSISETKSELSYDIYGARATITIEVDNDGSDYIKEPEINITPSSTYGSELALIGCPAVQLFFFDRTGDDSDPCHNADKVTIIKRLLEMTWDVLHEGHGN
jgi:hypothetical protein